MVKKLMVLALGLMILSSASLAFAEDVYVTKNGKKYHTQECPLIKNKGPIKISKEEAIEKGLAPCGKCFKDEVSLETKKQKMVKETK